MRLPLQNNSEGLDACFVGVPLDIGTTHRSGTRHGPRQIRNESIGLRPYNPATDVGPFDSLQVADIGDVGFTMYNLPEAVKQIREEYERIVAGTCIPLTMGGDHTITYPILQAIGKRHGPVGLVHVDAHADTTDEVWGSATMHATPFRRAIEEGLIQTDAFYQIGLRGSMYEKGCYDWARNQGAHIVPATECYHKSLTPLMAEVREVMRDRPVYLSFDIDAIDPCFCPGTGTREVGGLTTIQAIELVRGCKGLNIVGCDLVEVSPPCDVQGTTAHMGASLLFEMLCALPMPPTTS